MKLVGNFLSPYVRRAAISLHLLGLPFELDEVFVMKSPEKVRAINPLARIPVLLLGDGEAVIESAAILDAIDQMVPADRRLVPSQGAARRRVLRTVSLAVGAMEKAQWAFYETRMRPAEKVHEPWIEHNEAQVIGALEALEAEAAACGDEGWICDTPDIGQADISAAVAFSFVDKVRPALEVRQRFPALAAFTSRLEELEAFRAAPIPAS